MTKLKVKHASSLIEKALGLIGKREIVPLYFETRFGIHTFGVKEPIDVIIMNQTNHVVVLKENLQPNLIFFWNPKYKRVLELPKGTIAYKGVKLGSVLNFEIHH